MYAYIEFVSCLKKSIEGVVDKKAMKEYNLGLAILFLKNIKSEATAAKNNVIHSIKN